MNRKRHKSVYRLVTAPQGGTQKVHLGFCLRFSTLIGQMGRVPPFGAGSKRYIRSRLFRLAVTVFWLALPLPGGKTASECRSFLGPFARQNCLGILRPSHLGTTRSKSYRPLRHTRKWQPTSLSKIKTHTARGCHTHARKYNARQRDKSHDSPATPGRTAKHTYSIARMATSQLNVRMLLHEQHVYASSEMWFQAAGRGIIAAKGGSRQ